MKTRSRPVVKSLFDKEAHESRLLILSFILFLAIGRSMQSVSGVDRYLLSFLQYAPGFLAVFWGAINGDLRNKKRLFERTHLPVSAFHLWAVSFGLPVIILSIAAWLSYSFDLIINADAATDTSALPTLPALFAFSYFISSISSQRFALAISVFAAIISSMVTQSYESESLVFFLSIALGSSASVLLSIVLKKMVRADIRRVITVVFLVIVVTVPSATKFNEILKSQTNEPFVAHVYTAANGAITIKAAGLEASSHNTAEFRDLRTKTMCIHTFKAGWHAAWVHQNRIAYFLESDPANGDAKITAWDIKTDRTQSVLRLPLHPDFETLCESGHFASVDPTGRYMIARLVAIQNSSVDLWLIDLKRGRGQVVMQSAAYFNPNRARWLPDKILIPSFRSRIIEVKISTGTARYLRNVRKVD